MPARRLTPTEALAIRTEWACRITRKKLAMRYGVSVRTIDNCLDRPEEYFRTPELPEPKVTEEEFLALVKAC